MNSDQQSDSKWIIPPGLLKTVRSFELLYKTLFDKASKIKNPPIIIFGPRGVGKTPFTMLFERFYLRDNPTITPDRVIRINAAAIPLTIIESELFGYVAGAFTDAKKETNGFVTQAENGLLILEEIGELQHSVQAKLLTFVEDHYYYKVGSRKKGTAGNIQIVATTNRKPTGEFSKEEFFRDDFLDRFCVFHVPPLYERRIDILYYLHDKFPDVVTRLEPFHVLALMAGNWPGNVRDIDNKIGPEIKRVMGETRLTDISMAIFEVIEQSFSLSDKLKTLLERFKSSGVDVDLLEKELNRYGLRLFPQTDRLPAFPSPLRPIVSEEESEKYNVRCYRIEPFDRAYTGFPELFCPIFDLYEFKDRNLLDVAVMGNPRQFTLSASRKEYKQLADQISSALRQISADSQKKSPLLAHIRSRERSVSREPSICTMTEHDLLRKYYELLLQEEHGNKAAVAKRAGIPPKSIYDKLKRLKIQFNRVRGGN